MRAAIFCALWGLSFARRANEIEQALKTVPDNDDTTVAIGDEEEASLPVLTIPDIDDTMLAIGDKGEALLPGLVPPEGYSYTFKLLEDGLAVNDYRTALSKVCQGETCEKLEKEPFMHANGSHWSNLYGRRAVNFHDSSGKRIFKLRSTKRMTDITRVRESFRIFPPHASNDSDVLFTINRDRFGQVKGFRLKDEWRVYRGHMKDNDQIYFGIGGRRKTQIYKIPGSDFKKHPDKKVGSIKKKWTKKAVVGKVLGVGDLLGDDFTVNVTAGEDSGVLIVLAIIVDMYQESKAQMGVADFDVGALDG
eukprot:TRINITY_DN1264_c1_g4_i1.p1 TRINITY_DN1264_c1_g4~~TRINITY_DN1264_c1_g4_i1.p1  ORF type:complete len:306 (+),score=55.50 TRINITY_DN1264_c1_g4_i1:56-973(+)